MRGAGFRANFTHSGDGVGPKGPFSCRGRAGAQADGAAAAA